MERPVSATHPLVATSGIVAYLLGAFFLWGREPFAENVVESALFLLLLTTAAVFIPDVFWARVHRRPSTGLDFSRDDYSLERVLVKLLGLGVTVGLVAMAYWIFPEYHGSFYDNYYKLLKMICPLGLLLAVPYFFWIDRKMVNPRDGYWHMGRLAMFHRKDVDGKILRQHLLGWTIKGFFLPLMFTYLCNYLSGLLAFRFSSPAPFKTYYDFFFQLLFFIDTGIVSMGYLMSFRLTDTHIRSSEPTMGGWVVALVCYEPFWSCISQKYLSYETDFKWGGWLASSPFLAFCWGGAILVLLAIYVWATAVFGARFSNLTHRGIITNGPYRWSKHPAYIAKNISWWLISVPFLARGSWDVAVRQCLLLLGVNVIYFLRAKTEEWHLSRDPVYRTYVRDVEKNGLGSVLSQWKRRFIH